MQETTEFGNLGKSNCRLYQKSGENQGFETGVFKPEFELISQQLLFYYCTGLSSQTQNFVLIQVNASNYKSVPSENYLVSNTVLCGTNTVWQHHSSDAVVVGVETSMMVSRALRTQYIYQDSKVLEPVVCRTGLNQSVLAEQHALYSQFLPPIFNSSLEGIYVHKLVATLSYSIHCSANQFIDGICQGTVH